MKLTNSCTYSFRDLYIAAFKKEPSKKELLDLFAKPRELINQSVRQWAKIAGWKTDDRKGLNGQTYTVFWPPL